MSRNTRASASTASSTSTVSFRRPWSASATTDDDDRPAVSDTAAELMGASISPNTRRAYAGALHRLDAWLDDAALAEHLGHDRRRDRGGRPLSRQARGPGQVAGVNWSQADAMLRVSEVPALTVADLERDGAGTITICHSKTDQEGNSATLFLGPSTVAHRIRTWLDAAGIEAPDAPLFQRFDRAGHVRGPIRAIITARAKAAGVEGRVSRHSLRIGAA